MHDLDLPADVFNILGSDELALGDGLAGELSACGLLDAEVGGAELALAKLAAKAVDVLELSCLAAEDGFGHQAGARHALHVRRLLVVHRRRCWRFGLGFGLLRFGSWLGLGLPLGLSRGLSRGGRRLIGDSDLIRGVVGGGIGRGVGGLRRSREVLGAAGAPDGAGDGLKEAAAGGRAHAGVTHCVGPGVRVRKWAEGGVLLDEWRD